MNKDKESIENFLLDSISMGNLVKEATNNWLKRTNIPTIGSLHNFNFDLENGVYTISHTFEYCGEVKSNFYVIELEELWTTK